MPSTHREDASPPQTSVPSYQRSESLPATPSDALRPPPPVSLQYRYPGPAGYWPMSYDMRLWAGLQMQQYMMDPRHSDHHGSAGKCCGFLSYIVYTHTHTNTVYLTESVCIVHTYDMM